MIAELDGGAPLTIVAGMHAGCFELFAHDHIRGIADLKGGSVGVPPGFETPRHLVSIMASYVGSTQIKISIGSVIRRRGWSSLSNGRSMHS